MSTLKFNKANFCTSDQVTGSYFESQAQICSLKQSCYDRKRLTALYGELLQRFPVDLYLVVQHFYFALGKHMFIFWRVSQAG